jgi:hypothetical protein
MQGLWKDKRKHFIRDKKWVYYKEDKLSPESYKKVFSKEKENKKKYEDIEYISKIYYSKLTRETPERINFNESLCRNCEWEEEWLCFWCHKIKCNPYKKKKESIFDYVYFDKGLRKYVSYYKKCEYGQEFKIEKFEETGEIKKKYKKRINSYYSFNRYNENKFFYGKKEFMPITRIYHSHKNRKKECKKLANKIKRRKVKLYLKNTINFDKGFPKSFAYEKSIAWCID